MAKHETEYPVGYQIPIHRSLTTTLYWMGVPRNFLICEVIFLVFGVVIAQSFWVPVLVVPFHLFFRSMGQKDPLFHKVFRQSIAYKSIYRP